MTQFASGPTGSVHDLCFLNVGGESVLAAARMPGLELIDAGTGELRRVLSAEFSPTTLAVLDEQGSGGQVLLAGGGDGTVYGYDPATGEQAFTHVFGGGSVRDLEVFGEAGSQSVLAALDEGLRLWVPGTGEVGRLDDPAGLESHRLLKVCAYLSEGRYWVTGGYTDGHLATWELLSGRAPVAQRAHDGPIWSVIAAHDGGGPMVISGGSDRRARVWRPSEGGHLLLGEVFTADSTIRQLGPLSDLDTTIVVTASAAGTVSLWRLDGPGDLPDFEITRHMGEVWALACASTDEGLVVASGDMSGGIRVKRLSAALVSERSVRVPFSADTTIWAVTHGSTAQGPYVATAGVDQTVSVIDSTGAHVRTMRGHTSTIRALAAAGGPTEAHLISGGADHRVCDWDPASGQLRAELPMGHQGEVWALAVFELDGALHVVSGSADGSVRLLALDGPPELARLPRILATDCGEVTALVVLPDVGGGTVVVGSGKGLRALSLREGTGHLLALPAIAAATGVREGDRWLVVAARHDGVVQLVDPVAGATVARFHNVYDAGQVRALTTVRVASSTFVLGGCDDGQLLTWSLDGTLVANPARGGSAGVRALDVADLPTGNSGTQQTLISAGHDGALRLWPIASDSPLRRTDPSAGRVRTASFLLQDQPAVQDRLSRAVLIETLYDALSSPHTTPPVVVGIHAPWGQGKSSVLHQLRHRVDPWTEPGDGTVRPVGERETSHRLVPSLPPRERLGGRRRPPAQVRTRLTRAWAWRQVRRAGDGTTPLAYDMRPAREGEHNAITVWFNPWLYERTDQLWAGLTREILTAVTDRLPRAERERLWFDLNLRRTDAAALRKRILASYLPRTLWGVLGTGLLLFCVTVAVVAMGTTAVNNPRITALIGPTVLLILTTLVTVAQVTSGSFQQIHGWLSSDQLNGTVPDAWRGGHDPLTTTDRGYLYLLQHDVGEVMSLATRSGPLYIFIDDMDRCGPGIVAETVGAVNLFLNKAFGPCIFVIALDPTTVAAHLESAFRDINESIAQDTASFGHLAHSGWRFMEKIIDLPIRLPRISDVALSQYFTGLLETASAGNPDEQLAAARQRAVPVRSGAEATRTSRPPSGQDPAHAAEVELAIVDPLTSETRLAVVNEFENLPPVRDALRTAVLGLPGRNPRQAKAFINLWRFYMVLDHRSGMFPPSLLAIERHSLEVARVVELMLRWPFLLDMLGAPAGDEARNLDQLLDFCGSDDEAWADVANRLRLDPTDRSIGSLREHLHRALPHRDVFTAIAHRLL
jgi:WD40 repeat protein